MRDALFFQMHGKELVRQKAGFTRRIMNFGRGPVGFSRFAPIYQQRVWGGRAFESVFGRRLPREGAFGESWEAVDRADACTMLEGGALAGWNLHRAWSERAQEIFGKVCVAPQRFPLLIKFLDARENLSVQVHPRYPGTGVGRGEPKSEWWYVVDAQPGAAVYAGFKRGVELRDFQSALLDGTVEPLLHRISVRKGDSLYVPSGRCHAIGAGCLIAEIQQNSDTTFRVFDWNRRDAGGAGRALHVEDSLACIDFSDHEPSLEPALQERPFQCEFFSVSLVEVDTHLALSKEGGSIFWVLDGEVCPPDNPSGRLVAGDGFLCPAFEGGMELIPVQGSARLLRVDLPDSAGC